MSDSSFKYSDEEIRMMAKRLIVAKDARDPRYTMFCTTLSLYSGIPVAILEQKIDEYADRIPEWEKSNGQ